MNYEVDLLPFITDSFCDALDGIDTTNLVLHDIDGKKVDVILYAASWERQFEQNLLNTGYERKTTFMSDISIAELYGLPALLDTLKRAIHNWFNNVEYFGELIMAVNLKAWEQAARGNKEWSIVYSELYYAMREIYFHVAKEGDRYNEYYEFYMNNID